MYVLLIVRFHIFSFCKNKFKNNLHYYIVYKIRVNFVDHQGRWPVVGLSSCR